MENWRGSRESLCHPRNLQKKFRIAPTDKIATAGSCFAQHISRHLRKNGYNVLDVEPPPPGLRESKHQDYGFSMYSARYGNIYTVRQLLQLAQEVLGQRSPQNFIWQKDNRFFDALRTAVEPNGFDTSNEVIAHRQPHISRVKELFKKLDIFIFTLGLTEMWVHKASGTVFPTAPGTLIGKFDPDLYVFQNAYFSDIVADFNSWLGLLIFLSQVPLLPCHADSVNKICGWKIASCSSTF